MVAHLRLVDEDLAQRVGSGLGFEELPDAPVPAAPVQEMPPSPALQIISKMKPTLKGRAIGILIAHGSDGAVIGNFRSAAADAGAHVKIVAHSVGGICLADGSKLEADAQLAGTPSVLFDAVVIILSAEGVSALQRESAAVDFVREAFNHLKAIAVDQGGQTLLDKAHVKADAGICDSNEVDRFIAAAQTRQWEREMSVRTLA
jgi:catalase